MGACEPVCRNSLIVVPAFFLIFGGLILIFVGAAFSPKSRADGMTFTREARLSISVPCIVTGVVLVSLGIIHCVAMAVCLPLAKQYLQRSQGTKLARQGDTAGRLEENISVSSDDILAAEGEGVAIGPRRRRDKKLEAPEIFNEEPSIKKSDISARVKSPVVGSPVASPTQPAAMSRLLQINAMGGRQSPNRAMMV